MKKKITKMLCLVLAMATLLATGAMAASPASSPGPDVRVNGEIVDFPDGQPYSKRSWISTPMAWATTRSSSATTGRANAPRTAVA